MIEKWEILWLRNCTINKKLKRGAKKGKVVPNVVKYTGTTKDLYEFIEDAENKIRLDDVKFGL